MVPHLQVNIFIMEHESMHQVGLASSCTLKDFIFGDRAMAHHHAIRYLAAREEHLHINSLRIYTL